MNRKTIFSFISLIALVLSRSLDNLNKEAHQSLQVLSSAVNRLAELDKFAHSILDTSIQSQTSSLDTLTSHDANYLSSETNAALALLDKENLEVVQNFKSIKEDIQNKLSRYHSDIVDIQTFSDLFKSENINTDELKSVALEKSLTETKSKKQTLEREIERKRESLQKIEKRELELKRNFDFLTKNKKELQKGEINYDLLMADDIDIDELIKSYTDGSDVQDVNRDDENNLRKSIEENNLTKQNTLNEIENIQKEIKAKEEEILNNEELFKKSSLQDVLFLLKNMNLTEVLNVFEAYDKFFAKFHDYNNYISREETALKELNFYKMTIPEIEQVMQNMFHLMMNNDKENPFLKAFRNMKIVNSSINEIIDKETKKCGEKYKGEAKENIKRNCNRFIEKISNFIEIFKTVNDKTSNLEVKLQAKLTKQNIIKIRINSILEKYINSEETSDETDLIDSIKRKHDQLSKAVEERNALKEEIQVAKSKLGESLKAIEDHLKADDETWERVDNLMHTLADE